MRKIVADVPWQRLHYDTGDIETLAPFFPQHPRLEIEQGFCGDIRQLRWDGDELVVHRARRRWTKYISPRRWFREMA
jgi:hypothetical protein